VIYLLYSNDYELFLGGNTVPEREVLITPTAMLLDRCSSIGIPMTLFCDVACLWRYRELGLTEFPAMVDEQLADALKAHHDVQVHLHPHWFTTKVEPSGNGCRYRFDYREFLLGNTLPDDPICQYTGAVKLLARCRQYLIDLLSGQFPSYRCVAFRAGGYGIQPKTETILKALAEAGYLIDSSIVPGMVMESNVNRIDFSDVPRQGNYYLSYQNGWREDVGGGVYEIPVAACDGQSILLLHAFVKRLYRWALRRIRGKMEPPAPVRGYAVQTTDDKQRKRHECFLNIVWRKVRSIMRGWQMLELSDDAALMAGLTRSYITRYLPLNGDLFLSFSCHSKSITEALLHALEKFNNIMVKEYGSDLRAITFQEASRLINGQMSSALTGDAQ